MEIRQVAGGVGYSPARPVKAEERRTSVPQRPSTDRVELSRQWVQNMEDQRSQSEAALLAGAKEKKSDGILDMLDGTDAGSDELDALSEQLDSQMKCMKIASNIMKGKKVPPQDEQYLMEHDPEAYKLAVSMRGLVKEDDEECKSVLEDEEERSSQTSEPGEAAPVDSGETASGGESSAPSTDAE